MGITGIFDGLYLDQLFQKTEQGETVFYPFGLMGRGYLLPAEREGGVRRSMRLLMLVSLIIGTSLGLLVLRIVESSGPMLPAGWVIGGGIFGLLIGLIVYFQSRLAIGLEPVDVRVPAGEWLRRGRTARAAWTYWASVAGGVFLLLLAAAGMALGFEDGDPWGVVAGAILLLLGVVLTWDGAMGLIERSKGAMPE
jgi:hypothetical protein